MRRGQSLSGGTHGLREDAVAELGAQPAAGDEVHLAAEEGFESLLDVEELEEAYGCLELDEEVHVAPGPSLVARDGAEDGEGAHAHGAQLRLVAGDDLEYLGPAHEGIIGRAGGGANLVAGAGAPRGLEVRMQRGAPCVSRLREGAGRVVADR